MPEKGFPSPDDSPIRSNFSSGESLDGHMFSSFERWAKEAAVITLEHNDEGMILAPHVPGKERGLVSEIQDELLSKVVRTKAFKVEFGDWDENPAAASRAVYETTGEPMIAFHATPENISPSEGLRGRDLSYTMPSGTHISKVKPVHFSSNPSVASYYGSYKVDDPVQRAYRTGAVRMDQIRRVDPWVLAKTFKPTDTVVLYPCFLNIRRPARDEAGGETHSDAPDGNIWRSPKETRFQVYDVKSDGTQIFHIPYSLGEYRPTPRKKR